jgi:hypothetical protein
MHESIGETVRAGLKPKRSPQRTRSARRTQSDEVATKDRKERKEIPVSDVVISE